MLDATRRARGTLDTYDPEQVTRMRRVNVEGLISATQAVIGGMRARRYGRIINISSIAGIGTVLPGNAFYAATKAEVAILTKRFALELGPHNITVNAVAPGFVRTDMTKGGRGAGNWLGTEEAFAAKAMMGRIGEPEDIANAIAFLASPEFWLDHGTDVDRGRRTDGLHRTCVVVVSGIARVREVSRTQAVQQNDPSSNHGVGAGRAGIQRIAVGATVGRGSRFSVLAKGATV